MGQLTRKHCEASQKEKSWTSVNPLWPVSIHAMSETCLLEKGRGSRRVPCCKKPNRNFVSKFRRLGCNCESFSFSLHIGWKPPWRQSSSWSCWSPALAARAPKNGDVDGRKRHLSEVDVCATCKCDQEASLACKTCAAGWGRFLSTADLRFSWRWISTLDCRLKLNSLWMCLNSQFQSLLLQDE